jgi:acyl carrier protein
VIANLSDDEVRQTVTNLLFEEIASVLRMPVQKITGDATIYDLGMDSLMAVELVTAIENRFAISVPSTAVTGGATAAQIASGIAARLLQSVHRAERPEGDDERTALTSLAARHGESPERVAELLQRLSPASRRD